MRRPIKLLLLLLALLVPACADEEATFEYDRAQAWKSLGFDGTEAEFDAKLASLKSVPIDPPPVVGRDYTPVFPDPIPFDPSEWLTNEPTPSVADPRAAKGGKLRLATSEWPATLRTEGPNSRSAFLSDIHNIVFEQLLNWDTVLNDFTPGLATHWQVLDDKLTFRFRMDPRARWADGREVTADDVVATVEHYMNPDRMDAVTQQWEDIVDHVRALDKYTVEIKSKSPRWRNAIDFGLMNVYPAAYIRMDGETYLGEWNWRIPPGSGPYELRPEDLKKGRSIMIRRREDWWARDLPEYRGAFNFDKIEWQVVRSSELEYQKFLAGELDVYRVTRAQRWVDELEREEAIKNGWVQMRKIYNLNPEGYGGYCFNLRKPPFDELNLRLAFSHLFNRELMFAKYFYFQYEYIDSYYPGQPWGRPDAERIRYDPARARALLAEEGWTGRDEHGFLANEAGERFPILTMEFSDAGYLRIHEVIRNELWDQAGIKLELKLVDGTSLTKKIWDKNFDITWWNWTAGIFPDPKFQFHSQYADLDQSNNLNGLKSPEADRIIEVYDLEFDGNRRIELLQQLDEILFDAQLYSLNWYAPFFRVIYWDRFGHPPEYASRYGDSLNNVIYFWWFDEERDRRTEEAKAAGRPSYPEKKLNQYDDVTKQYWRFNDRPMPEDPR